MWLRNRRFGRSFAVTLTAAALAAPAALAGTDTGIGVPAGRDVLYPAHQVITENSQGQKPDVARSSYATALRVRGEAFNRIYGHAPVQLVSENGRGQTPTSAATVATASADSFDWSDASLAAAAVFGLVLLLGTGATLGVRRTRALVQ